MPPPSPMVLLAELPVKTTLAAVTGPFERIAPPLRAVLLMKAALLMTRLRRNATSMSACSCTRMPKSRWAEGSGPSRCPGTGRMVVRYCRLIRARVCPAI